MMTENKQNLVPEIRFNGFNNAWEKRKLGDLYTERNKRGNDSLQILSVSIHHGASNEELDSKDLGKKVRRSEDKSLYKHVYFGDLVLNMMRAWQGAIGVVKSEGMVSPAYITAIPSSQLHPLFMDYCLRRNEMISQMDHLSYGVTDFRKRLYWDSFINVSCHIPSVSEQEKITDFFSQLDDTITLHKRKLDGLRELKKGYLQQMFPQAGEREPRVRFAGFSGEWMVYKLGEIANIISGGTPDTTNPDYWGPDIDWYSPVEIGKDIYAFRSQRKITKLGLQKSSAKVLPADKTILFTSRAGIGDMAILKSPAATNQGFQSIVVKEGFDVYFIFSVGGRIKDFALKNASGSTFLEITGKSLSKMELVIPSLEEQIAIGNFFRNLDERLTAQTKKVEQLHQLKVAYLKKMFI